MTVDRQARDRLIDIVNRYLAGEIAAFEFDEEIGKIRDGSDDSVVKKVVGAMWLFYDDCKDHKVVLTKEGWDLFQRVILLLKSDACVKCETYRRWSVTQLVAAVALAGCAYFASYLGFSQGLFAVTVPFGFISIGLFYWRRSFESETSLREMLLVPFGSVGELLAVRRSVHDFKKQRYPAPLESRRIRSPMMEFALRIQFYASWCLFSPLVLFCQMFPDAKTETRVVASLD